MVLDGVGWCWMVLDGVGWCRMGLDGVGWCWLCFYFGLKTFIQHSNVLNIRNKGSA